jgi:hypothetical protein
MAQFTLAGIIANIVTRTTISFHGGSDLRQAVAIVRTTGIRALLFSGLSRRKGERGETRTQ